MPIRENNKIEKYINLFIILYYYFIMDVIQDLKEYINLYSDIIEDINQCILNINDYENAMTKLNNKIEDYNLEDIKIEINIGDTVLECIINSIKSLYLTYDTKYYKYDPNKVNYDKNTRVPKSDYPIKYYQYNNKITRNYTYIINDSGLKYNELDKYHMMITDLVERNNLRCKKSIYKYEFKLNNFNLNLFNEHFGIDDDIYSFPPRIDNIINKYNAILMLESLKYNIQLLINNLNDFKNNL